MTKPPTNRSLLRGFDILHAFNRVQTPTLTAIAAETGLPKSTTSRFLSVLVDEGYLRVGERQVYQLTPRVLELGFSALCSLGISEIVAGPLQEVADACRGAANIAELDGTDVIIIARRTASQQRERFFSMNIHIGTRLPALYTATGRILLASRPDLLERALETRDSDRPHAGSTPDKQQLMDAIDEIRRSNIAIIKDELAPGFGAAAISCKIGTTREVALSGSYLLADHEPDFGKRVADLLIRQRPTLTKMLASDPFATPVQ